jgi:nucleoside-diphosphate-sugar epimerase
MGRHVVLGTGQAGRQVVDRLAALDHEVVAVNRSGAPVPGAARVLGGDLLDAGFVAQACVGAEVVYACLNVDYAHWPERFPPLQRSVVRGARGAGARLVVLENLYGYGPTGGRPLTEDLPLAATYEKGEVRARMSEQLLEHHRAGDLEVAIGRASDYFGPGVRESILGEQVIQAVLHGKRVPVLGDPDLPHSYSFTPDVGAGLVTLGNHGEAFGQAWHLPVAEARTTREVVEQLGRLAGQEPRLLPAGAGTLRVLGIFRPQLRELRHTLYQCQQPWIVDDSRFRATFGDLSTPLDEALARTLAWYRDQEAAGSRSA